MAKSLGGVVHGFGSEQLRAGALVSRARRAYSLGMQTTPKAEVAAGGRAYLAVRETSDDGEEGYIALFAPDTEAELARITMARGGAMSLETFGGPLPRPAVEWLLGKADTGLALG